MAATGDEEIVVAVHAQFHRALQLLGGQSRNACKLGGLRFFAPKPAPHAAAHHPHLVRCPAQSMGHRMLHFAGVLGGAVHQHAVVLGWNGVTDLPLQIKLLLPTQRPLSFQAVGCGLHGRLPTLGRLFTGEVHGRHHVLALGVALPDIQQGWQRRGLNHFFGAGGDAARHQARGGNHRKHRLAHKTQLTLRQDGVVVHDRAAVVESRNVVRGEDGHHASFLAQRIKLQGVEAAMGHR